MCISVIIRLTALFAACLFAGAVVAEPTYVGEYKYRSWVCGGSYGPFATEEAAVNAALQDSYWPAGCSRTAQTVRWATQSSPVGNCGGIRYPTFIEGVENQGAGDARVNYKGGTGCSIDGIGTLFLSRERVVCRPGEMFFSDTQRCEQVQKQDPATGPASNPKNKGVVCPDCSRGDPVNPATGNNWRIDVDYDGPVANGLHFARTYNSTVHSADAFDVNNNGVRWTHTYERRLRRTILGTGPVLQECYVRWEKRHHFCIGPVPDPTGNDIIASRSDGKTYYYRWDGANYVSDSDVNARLVLLTLGDHGSAVWKLEDGGEQTEYYDAAGRLTEIAYRAGPKLLLTYSDGLSNDTSAGRLPQEAPACTVTQAGAVLSEGKLLCVTDSWGRQLQFEYDEKSRIRKLIDPAGQEINYTYDGPSGGCPAGAPGGNRACAANNLTRVLYPDNSELVYWYNEIAHINNGSACSTVSNVGNGFGHLDYSLTGIVDGNGDRFATWRYGCDGKITEHYMGASVERLTLEYYSASPNGNRKIYVTAYHGNPASPQADAVAYDFQIVSGVAKNFAVGKQCGDCGSTKARTYDANGNVASATLWNNMVSNFTYDPARNLEIKRVEAAGTALERTISTQWHSTLRLRTAVAEPNRITEYEYDSAAKLNKISVFATSDATGALQFNAVRLPSPRVTTMSHDTFGRITSLTAPGAVQATVSTYGFDGNKASETNPAGHQTTYADYDAHGRVGRVTDPNGLVTLFTYTPRGALSSVSVGGLLTSYSYDGFGQLTRSVGPDGVALDYAYDTAHRLVQITDSTGNQLRYQLDLQGNRIGETVIGDDATLHRRISRVFNARKELVQVTGALR